MSETRSAIPSDLTTDAPLCREEAEEYGVLPTGTFTAGIKPVGWELFGDEGETPDTLVDEIVERTICALSEETIRDEDNQTFDDGQGEEFQETWYERLILSPAAAFHVNPDRREDIAWAVRLARRLFELEASDPVRLDYVPDPEIADWGRFVLAFNTRANPRSAARLLRQFYTEVQQQIGSEACSSLGVALNFA
jgi:hypothetical protein